MSDIQTISQGNYILSNLAAQKLYAQSPLTTGVSGTSAYIGIEPSAQYNETVLWTNTNPSQISANVTLTGNFSENCSVFDRLRFVCKSSYDTGESISGAIQPQDFFVNTANNTTVVGVYLANRRGSTIYRDTCEIDFTDTGFTANNGSRIQGLTALSENTTRGPYILSVIGINRKENV